MSQPKTSPAKGPAKQSSFAVGTRQSHTAVEVKPAANAANLGTATGAKPVAPLVVTHELIAQRAYLKWKARGGDAQRNWAEAEAELRAEAARAGR